MISGFRLGLNFEWTPIRVSKDAFHDNQTLWQTPFFDVVGKGEGRRNWYARQVVGAIGECYGSTMPKNTWYGNIYVFISPQCYADDAEHIVESVRHLYERQPPREKGNENSMTAWEKFAELALELHTKQENMQEGLPQNTSSAPEEAPKKRTRSPPIPWGKVVLEGDKFRCQVTGVLMDQRYYYTTTQNQRKGCFQSLPIMARWIEDNVPNATKKAEMLESIKSEWNQADIPLAPPVDMYKGEGEAVYLEYLGPWLNIPGAETVGEYTKRLRTQKNRKKKSARKKPKVVKPKATKFTKGVYLVSPGGGSKVIRKLEAVEDVINAERSVAQTYKKCAAEGAKIVSDTDVENRYTIKAVIGLGSASKGHNKTLGCFTKKPDSPYNLAIGKGIVTLLKNTSVQLPEGVTYTPASQEVSSSEEE